MNTPPSSYEMLVSYADGQLDLSDREMVLTLLDMDADLNREVWELSKLKDLVELAYQDLPGFSNEPRANPWRSWYPRFLR
jgi:anti-sigma factor RsiW